MADDSKNRSRRWVIFPSIGVGSYLWLLLALFTLIVVAPLTSKLHLFNIRISDMLSLMILCVGIAAVNRSRIATSFLTLLALSAIGFQLFVHFTGSFWAGIGANLSGMIFLIGLFAIIAFDVFSARQVTAQTLAGACCGYVLMAGIFAAVYSVLLSFDGNALKLHFEGAIRPESLVFQSDSYGFLGYFSIVTLTTLGYGDIVPNNLATRSVASIEALIGQLYLAVVVARLVGMYLSTRSTLIDKPPLAAES